jgi:hypothetical protein
MPVKPRSSSDGDRLPALIRRQLGTVSSEKSAGQDAATGVARPLAASSANTSLTSRMPSPSSSVSTTSGMKSPSKSLGTLLALHGSVPAAISLALLKPSPSSSLASARPVQITPPPPA